jgi:hypothetical protein
MEVSARSEIGKIVDIQDIPNINHIILSTLKSYNSEEIIKIRDKYVYMKKDGLTKSAKRVVSIANSNRLRNLNNDSKY